MSPWHLAAVLKSVLLSHLIMGYENNLDGLSFTYHVTPSQVLPVLYNSTLMPLCQVKVGPL
jgi:hypothetical protein